MAMGWLHSQSSQHEGSCRGELLAWPLVVILEWHGESFPHARRWWCSRPVLTSRAMAHVLVGAGGWSCEADTCRARRRLLMRGGDLSCEAETCHGDPSFGELVGDAAN
jgi:hypothetical protein